MTNRTTSKILNFVRPFSMRGFAEVLPAGSYKVTTEETQDESVTYPTWQWVSTEMHLNTNSDRPVDARVVSVDPRDLEVAYLRDQKMIDARPESRIFGPWVEHPRQTRLLIRFPVRVT